MKQLLFSLFLMTSSLSATAQWDFVSPYMTVHDSVGVERSLHYLHQDGNATLYYFWARWCQPCINSIEEMRPYAKSWQEEYGVEIFLIVYDREMLSDSITSVNYHKNNNFDEIGQLYLIHQDDAEQAYEDIGSALGPWAKNYLHRDSDGKLIAQIGTSAATMDEAIKSFFNPVSTENYINALETAKVLQDDQIITVELEAPLKDGTLTVYGMDGKQYITVNIDEATSTYYISKDGMERNQIYAVSLSGSESGVVKFFVR